MNDISPLENLLRKMKHWKTSSAVIKLVVTDLRWSCEFDGGIAEIRGNNVSVAGNRCVFRFDTENSIVREQSPSEAPESLRGRATLEVVSSFSVELPEGVLIFLYELRVPQGSVM
ncbi:MAG: hypothetical protein ABSD63_09665 [Candidatus Korobacteraceae bacterium]|jgi:hypothetical protein